jgi:hypothetical protein
MLKSGRKRDVYTMSYFDWPSKVFRRATKRSGPTTKASRTTRAGLRNWSTTQALRSSVTVRQSLLGVGNEVHTDTPPPDPWYARGANADKRQHTPFYIIEPGPQYVKGQSPKPGWTKRDFDDPEDIYIDIGNSSRKPTAEELAEKFGLLKCQDGNCEAEMEALGYASLPLVGHTADLEPCTMDANATPAGTVTVTVTAAPLADAAQSTMSTISGYATRAGEAAQSVITETAKYLA